MHLRARSPSMDDKSARPKKRTASDPEQKEASYEPRYKGFDERATRQAQATNERAQERAGAKGMDANEAYVDEGPEEAARRTGRSAEELGASIEEAAKRGRRGG